MLDEEPAIQVIGAASDPIFAMERMTQQWPDVIVLDVEMPRMDGITFLKKIMAEHPTPVVICSTLTERARRPPCRRWPQVRSSIITKPQDRPEAFSCKNPPTTWWAQSGRRPGQCQTPAQTRRRHCAGCGQT